MTAGAGGWGDPLERNPAAVLRDVLDEKITPAHARREYGVVLATRSPAVRVAATASLRKAMSASRTNGPGQRRRRRAMSKA
jgi:N-methylhydantoinase B